MAVFHVYSALGGAFRPAKEEDLVEHLYVDLYLLGELLHLIDLEREKLGAQKVAHASVRGFICLAKRNGCLLAMLILLLL
jgi:hypothetical protein